MHWLSSDTRLRVLAADSLFAQETSIAQAFHWIEAHGQVLAPVLGSNVGCGVEAVCSPHGSFRETLRLVQESLSLFLVLDVVHYPLRIKFLLAVLHGAFLDLAGLVGVLRVSAALLVGLRVVPRGTGILI